ncbi:MAG: DUF177 domain-containing protein [Chitinophagaceae bacterium]|nr:DUF177 domain-containing protein [Chitinophagaceae bacterium]
MSRSREFEIAFVGLKAGIHEFMYRIDDSFFEKYSEQDFTNCQAEVKLTLDKKSSYMFLKFEIGGKLEVICDRCNSRLPIELWDEFGITLKISENPELMNEQENDADVYYIGKGDSYFDVADWIYEFINLSIPMQKVCSYENMDGPYCDAKAREILKQMTVHPSVNSKTKNPIWKGLENFKNFD